MVNTTNRDAAILSDIRTKIIADILNDKSEMLKRVFFCLVNQNWRAKEGLVSRQICKELKYIYKLDVSDIFGGGCVQVLKLEHLVSSGITEEELYKAALENVSVS